MCLLSVVGAILAGHHGREATGATDIAGRVVCNMYKNGGAVSISQAPRPAVYQTGRPVSPRGGAIRVVTLPAHATRSRLQSSQLLLLSDMETKWRTTLHLCFYVIFL